MSAPTAPQEPTPNRAKNFSTGLPSWNPDAVIIGSGMSGLVCASVLSARGKKVMVLEQHDTPGGSCHHFKQGTEWVSAGWHYVGKPTGPTRVVWDYITNHQPYTCDRDEVIDTLHGVGSITANTITEATGLKKQDLRRVDMNVTWLVLIKLLPAPLARLAWWFYKLTGKHKEAQMNWGEWCKKMTKSKEVREIWWTQRGDHGMPRDKSCALLSALILNHYRHGTMHPTGGVRETIMRIVDRIHSNGSVVLLKAPVSKINITGNQVTGVDVEGTTINTKQVIVSGADLIQTLTKEKCPKEISYAVKKLGPSQGHGAIFLTFTGKKREDLGLPQGNLWIDRKDEGGFFISTKSSATGCVCYILWEMDYIARGSDYEEAKDDAAQKGLDFACKLFPQLKEHDDYDAATPATTEFYLKSWKGNSYGLSMPPERYGEYNLVRALKPKTSINGLFLTGQDVMCCGVFAALATGWITAQAVCYPGLRGLFGNVLKDLLPIVKKEKKERGLSW